MILTTIVSLNAQQPGKRTPSLAVTGTCFSSGRMKGVPILTVRQFMDAVGS